MATDLTDVLKDYHDDELTAFSDRVASILKEMYFVNEEGELAEADLPDCEVLPILLRFKLELDDFHQKWGRLYADELRPLEEWVIKAIRRLRQPVLKKGDKWLSFDGKCYTITNIGWNFGENVRAIDDETGEELELPKDNCLLAFKAPPLHLYKA
jgi:hypothetical protein